MRRLLPIVLSTLLLCSVVADGESPAAPAAASSLSKGQAAFERFQPVFDSSGQLVVAAAIATQSPYQADNTGKADASAAIQKALGDVSAHGGGTVYLPAGRYRLDRHISVPATVTLCGDWRKPEPGQPLAGTVLCAYADRGNADGPSLLSAPECGHACVFNLMIHYPEQDPSEPVAYPFSIDGRVAYVHNITLVNSYQGILMSQFGGGSVAGIYGTVLKRGIVLKNSCELCTCYNLHLHSDYWTRLPEAAMRPPSGREGARVHPPEPGRRASRKGRRSFVLRRRTWRKPRPRCW